MLGLFKKVIIWSDRGIISRKRLVINFEVIQRTFYQKDHFSEPFL